MCDLLFNSRFVDWLGLPLLIWAAQLVHTCLSSFRDITFTDKPLLLQNVLVQQDFSVSLCKMRLNQKMDEMFVEI